MEQPEYMIDFIHQDQVWATKDGFIKIDDMTELHRRRAAQQLIRRARHLGMLCLYDGDNEGKNEVIETMYRLCAPTTWIRTTKLFKRLVEGNCDPDIKGVWLND